MTWLRPPFQSGLASMRLHHGFIFSGVSLCPLGDLSNVAYVVALTLRVSYEGLRRVMIEGLT